MAQCRRYNAAPSCANIKAGMENTPIKRKTNRCAIIPPEQTGEMNHNSLIEFERISVMRGPTLALDNVSLKIGIGEHVAILGPNGCGKSTLIKTITRECYPLIAEGSSVRILGEQRW